MNRVTLIGRIGTIREPREINSDRVVNLRVATEYKYRDPESESGYSTITDWHDIAAWNDHADRVLKVLQKGDLVYIEGPLKYREQTGVMFPRAQIRLTRFEFLDRPQKNRDKAEEPEVAEAA